MRSQRHVREYNPPDAAGQVMADVDEGYGRPGVYRLALNDSAVTLTHPANQNVVATLTLDGVVVEGVALTATSSATGVATVTGNGNTNSSGQVTFNVASVAIGSASVTFMAASLKTGAVASVVVS
jgi:hypothetical protein